VEAVMCYVHDYGRNTFTPYNQPAEYNQIDNTWSFFIDSSMITPGYQVHMWVRAKDYAGNWSYWRYRLADVIME